MSDTLIDRLAAHKTVGGAPRHELEWLVAHGTLLSLPAGEIVSQKGSPIEGMFILLSGRIDILIDRGAGMHKVMEWRAGDVTGVLPYSRVVDAPGSATTQEPTELFVVQRADIEALIRNCHALTTLLVHKMLDRARLFTSSGLHDEKMMSLGRLSAGLAHELNNPAAAIERSAALLDSRLEAADRAARALGGTQLTAGQLAAVDSVRVACMATLPQGVRSAIQQAEREEELSDWLADHGLDPDTSEVLADTAVTVEALDRLAAVITGPALDAALRWTASSCSVRRMASEIQEAAMRISGIVVAIKGFTHMDQAMVAEPVDLARSLANTVAVLKAKARGKGIGVELDLQPGLPRVHGFLGELNQIWANLVDNALDAAPQGGRVRVVATVERSTVTVRIIDNGSGIPPEIRPRLFEPFVTSKPVGQGTGLGLDIVRRLLIHNDGRIEFDSEPGRTEFRVFLPVEAADAGSSS